MFTGKLHLTTNVANHRCFDNSPPSERGSLQVYYKISSVTKQVDKISHWRLLKKIVLLVAKTWLIKGEKFHSLKFTTYFLDSNNPVCHYQGTKPTIPLFLFICYLPVVQILITIHTRYEQKKTNKETSPQDHSNFGHCHG